METVCQSCGRERNQESLFCGNCGQLFTGNGKIVINRQGGASSKPTFGQAATPKKATSKKKSSGSNTTLVTYSADDLGDVASALSSAASEFFVKSGKSHIYFGSYPQTLMADGVQIVSKKPNARGYYRGSDGALYAKVVATPLQTTYSFTNGVKIVQNREYYFKVEPIKWRILTSTSGVALLFSDKILTCHCYSSKDNNYAESDIRKWLNSTFINQAFTREEQIFLREMQCDNGVASTGYDKNPYACGPTRDYVFLLSIKELMEPKFGFEPKDKAADPARRKVTTDYARAMGVGVGDHFPGTCQWWTRSSAAFNALWARPVEESGGLNLSATTANIWTGVVPAVLAFIGE